MNSSREVVVTAGVGCKPIVYTSRSLVTAGWAAGGVATMPPRLPARSGSSWPAAGVSGAQLLGARRRGRRV